MTDEAAFLAAITAAPDDDAPKLVFADWLDDRGDPRGPWLRDPDIRPFMGPRCEDPVPRLIDALRQATPSAAQKALIRIGAPAVPALLAALRTPEPVHRAAVCGTLLELAADLAPFGPQLEAEAASPDPVVRDAALAALGCLSYTSGLGPLVERLDSPDPATWAAALQGIVDLTAIGAPAVPAVLRRWRREAAAGTGTAFRQTALPHLGMLGLFAPAERDETLALAIGALAHPVLGPLVPDAIHPFITVAVPPLRAALNTLDPAGVRLALRALYRVSLDPDALVAEVLADPRTPDRARRAILETVADGIHFNEDQLAPTVAAQLDHADPAIRRAAVAALGTVDPAAALRAIRDPDPDVRAAAVRVAGRIAREDDGDTGRARNVLRLALIDPADPVRAAAQDDYLCRNALSDLVHDLQTWLTHRDPEPDTRPRAVAGLGRVLAYQPPRPPGPVLLFSAVEPAEPDARIVRAREDASARLVEALGDRSRAVRLAAATVLATYECTRPADAHGPLVEALADPTPAIREQAALGLVMQGLGSEPAIQACLKLLRDEDVGVIAAALTALGTMRRDRSDLDRKLRPFLRDRSARVRTAAGRALATLGGPRVDVLDDALDLAADRNDGARAAGVRLLSRIDPNIIGGRLAGHLRRALRDPAPVVRAAVVEVLHDRPVEFVRPFQSDLVRALAAEAEPGLADAFAGLLRARCPDRVPDLAPLLDDPAPAVRARALAALAGAGAATGPVVPRLVAAYEAGPPDLRLPVLRALEGVGPAAAPAVPLLAALLDGGDTELADAAAVVARSLGPAGAPLVPRLTAIWQDFYSENRSRAIQALAQLAGDCPGAVPPVREGLAHDGAEVVRYVLLIVAHLGPKAELFLPDLIGLLTHADREVRYTTGDVLRAMGPAAAPAVEALIAAAGRESEWLAKDKFLEALGAIGPAAARAVPFLIETYDRADENGLVQLRAVQALRQLRTPDALPFWQRSLFDPDGGLREMAAQALADIGPAVGSPGTELEFAL